MRRIIETINTTNPGQPPVTGDLLEIHYSDESVDRLEFVADTIETVEEESFIISVGSLLDRLDIDNKLDQIYAMVEQGKQQNPPDMTLYKYISNMRQREFINLQDPRLRPTIAALQLYTEEELDDIFSPAQVHEVPIAVAETGV